MAKQWTKRDVYHEPRHTKFLQQWYLSGIASVGPHNERGLGSGLQEYAIVVSILDDGIEKNHPDLPCSHDPGASFNVNNQDPDPQPRYTCMDDNWHGTRCAGQEAEVTNNSVCGIGVVYNACIGGVHILGSEVTDVVEASSLRLNPNHIHIHSASCGPKDDSKTMDRPVCLTKEAFSWGEGVISQGHRGWDPSLHLRKWGPGA